MSCGNRRETQYGIKPEEIITAIQSFNKFMLANNTTCTSITASSIGPVTVVISGQDVNLGIARWSGQLSMASDGDGIVQILASFADGQIQPDFIHLCRTVEVAI